MGASLNENQRTAPSQRPTAALPPSQPQSRPSQLASASGLEHSRYLNSDHFSSLDQVTAALRREGLKSSNLIVGIDFTKSNEWTGKISFNKQCLHAIGNTANPYEKAFSIIGKTLASFDDDNLIPCFGFGDATTHDQEVFSFHIPNLELSGPTSYAPVIEAAIDTVVKNHGQFHVLLIISDGQVTRSVDTDDGELSPQEQMIQAIAEASFYPLSIVLVGVGDGPWDDMEKLFDKIPVRGFNNFQFVNFTEMMSISASPVQKEAAFALAALKKIPFQYKAAVELGLLGHITRRAKKIVQNPPPVRYSQLVPPARAASADDQRIQMVTAAMRKGGLESANLIVGIDFTKSNERTGKISFNKRSLHAIGDTPNPYEKVLSIIGKTLAPFDDDNLIHCFGFGDATTRDQEVFSFHRDHCPCHGFEEVLACYQNVVPNLKFSGPTSYAPVIEAAIDIVEKNHDQFHVLLIIADSKVTRSIDTDDGEVSPQEQKTIQAIAEASFYPLSIVLVGVGDGPWDGMEYLHDNIPKSDFNKFQFVNFTEIMSVNASPTQKEATFALLALMELPFQYKAAVELGLLGRRHITGRRKKVVPNPPPVRYRRLVPLPPARLRRNNLSLSADDEGSEMVCVVCLTNAKDLAFQCGHMTCRDCGSRITNCHICRERITHRLRVFTG
ncbi:hypothetical protein L6164_022913 [Bauhinia variegata]|uniref:Uncharacterized protein n=1 Tax=Bauhinia variegata TaxID=167791 RepID=A0ACB9MHJ4_BAUVA|nr:hypothetical protein L6164_022913 [Bauhinia variegata]